MVYFERYSRLPCIFRYWFLQFHACRVTLGPLPVSLASGSPLFDRSVLEPPEPFRVTSTL